MRTLIIASRNRITDQRRGRTLAAVLLLLVAVCAFLLAPGRGETPAAASGGGLSGTVIDAQGPVAGATVRIQGTTQAVLTGPGGRFVLAGAPPGAKVNLSAWKQGYYSALLENVTAPLGGIVLTLLRYQTTDNDRYAWIPPEGSPESCQECHPDLTEMSLRDPHLKAARNPRFLSMYEGTDTLGNRSPPTRYDKGRGPWKQLVVPWPPDPGKPYYGPGYQLDFPGTTGNCTACHIPGAVLSRQADPRGVEGADRYGIHCDFCHKIAAVRIDPVTQLPFPRFPGVHSLELRRPFPEDKQRRQLFFGSFDDPNAAAGDTNHPLYRESRYCGACHYGVFWNTVIYNSYGEWLASPYADPGSGRAKTCQECHMPSPTIHQGKALTNVAPAKGGIERDPGAIHNHDMTVDAELLRNALTMEARAERREGRIAVTVTLTNDKTGHHVPTDSPLRHLILLVEAVDARGAALPQLTGPRLPDWCGKAPAKGDHYAGRPGKAYAKLLKEKWTDVFPTGAYWNHTELVSDNRLAAFAADTAEFAFAAPVRQGAVVTVKLLYRRAFITLMEQKQWNVPDIVMAEGRFFLKP